MKTRIVGKSTGIPILIGHETIELEGYTEIISILRDFDGTATGSKRPERPEVRSYQDRLEPRPMAALGSQSFKHILNEDVPKLLRRWERQLEKMMGK